MATSKLDPLTQLVLDIVRDLKIDTTELRARLYTTAGKQVFFKFTADYDQYTHMGTEKGGARGSFGQEGEQSVERLIATWTSTAPYFETGTADKSKGIGTLFKIRRQEAYEKNLADETLRGDNKAGYRGHKRMNRKHGNQCILWSKKSNRLGFHKEGFGTTGERNNYCRNPDGEDNTWCYDDNDHWFSCTPLSTDSAGDWYQWNETEAHRSFAALDYGLMMGPVTKKDNVHLLSDCFQKCYEDSNCKSFHSTHKLNKLHGGDGTDTDTVCWFSEGSAIKPKTGTSWKWIEKDGDGPLWTSYVKIDKNNPGGFEIDALSSDPLFYGFMTLADTSKLQALPENANTTLTFMEVFGHAGTLADPTPENISSAVWKTRRASVDAAKDASGIENFSQDDIVGSPYPNITKQMYYQDKCRAHLVPLKDGTFMMYSKGNLDWGQYAVRRQVIPKIYLPSLVAELSINEKLKNALFSKKGTLLQDQGFLTNLEMACIFPSYISTMRQNKGVGFSTYGDDDFRELCESGFRDGLTDVVEDHEKEIDDAVIRFCETDGYAAADILPGQCTYTGSSASTQLAGQTECSKGTDVVSCELIDDGRSGFNCEYTAPGKYSLLAEKSEHEIKNFCACASDPCTMDSHRDKLACKMEKHVFQGPSKSRKCYNAVCNNPLVAYQSAVDEVVECTPFCTNVNIQDTASFGVAKAEDIVQFCGDVAIGGLSLDKVKEMRESLDAMECTITEETDWGICELDVGSSTKRMSRNVRIDGPASKCAAKLKSTYLSHARAGFGPENSGLYKVYKSCEVKPEGPKTPGVDANAAAAAREKAAAEKAAAEEAAAEKAAAERAAAARATTEKAAAAEAAAEKAAAEKTTAAAAEKEKKTTKNYNTLYIILGVGGGIAALSVFAYIIYYFYF